MTVNSIHNSNRVETTKYSLFDELTNTIWCIHCLAIKMNKEWTCTTRTTLEYMFHERSHFGFHLFMQNVYELHIHLNASAYEYASV